MKSSSFGPEGVNSLGRLLLGKGAERVRTWFCLVLFAILLLPTPALADDSVRGSIPVPSNRASASIGTEARENLESSKTGVPRHDLGSDAPRAASMDLPPIPEGFSVQDLGWLSVAYHPSLAAKMRLILDEAEQIRAELTATLGRSVLGRVHLRVGRTAGEMETLAPIGSGFPRYASGVAYSELGLVLLTATPRYPGERLILAEVFRHELAHIALHDAVSRDRVPRWFNEGFAVHASGEASSARLSTLWTATLSGNLIPFRKLTSSFPADAMTASVAYAQAADLVRFLLRQGEEHRFSALIQRVAGGQSFESALSDAYSTDMFTLEQHWREDVARRYTFWPVIFGGSLIWIAALGLLIWGYFRRRARATQKLARWTHEEAIEDARRQWAQSLLERARAVVEAVGAVGSSSTEGDQLPVAVTQDERAIPIFVRPVPKVEHDGERYTLH